MKSFFKELFDYSHHYNQQLGDLFEQHQESVSEKAIAYFSHILNAHQVWNNRIDSQQKQFGVWQVHPIQNFKQLDQANYEHSLHILDNFELDQLITYQNSTGQSFSGVRKEILFHIINHSTYHRGQIASEFRQCGLNPLVTDYIVYKR